MNINWGYLSPTSECFHWSGSSSCWRGSAARGAPAHHPDCCCLETLSGGWAKEDNRLKVRKKFCLYNYNIDTAPLHFTIHLSFIWLQCIRARIDVGAWHGHSDLNFWPPNSNQFIPEFKLLSFPNLKKFSITRLGWTDGRTTPKHNVSSHGGGGGGALIY